MTTRTISEQQMAAWRSFLSTHAALIDCLAKEMEAETGLPLNWYEVLLYLFEADDQRLRMHELANSLLLSRSAATRFVDRMEQAGLVERVQCPSDRRGTFVSMTRRGMDAFHEAAPFHLRGIERHFAAHVSESDAEWLRQIMGRLGAGLGDAS
jgi:DNA-binding MarR family transcriptional regulator